MLTMINNPPRWLAKALGIVEGVAAPAITTELHQVVDAVQGGHALATHTIGAQTGAVGSVTSIEPISSTDPDVIEGKYAYLFRMSVDNAGTAPSQVELLIGRPGAGTLLRLVIARAVPATTNHYWNEIGAGLGQYAYIPPGFYLSMAIGSGTTLALTARWELVRLPAGVHPW